MNAPYSPIHYVYLVHEDIDGNVSYATEKQMDTAEITILSVLDIFNQHKRIKT